MHYEVMQWLKQNKRKYPDVFRGRALECGGNNAHWSARQFFGGCDYVSLDARPGPGVDVVGLVHEYEAEPFDAVVSMLMLEHDPHWRESLRNMVHLLKDGGSLLLAWAGPGYQEHDLQDSPEPGYYRNLDASEVVPIVNTDRFDNVRFEFVAGCFHLLATGKRGMICLIT